MRRFIKASYNEATRTVEYVADNGDRLLRSGGTIAWRFNNPGNLRPGPKYTLHIGQGKTASGPFLIFPSVEAGRTEKKTLLLRKYKDESISSMLYIYAPPNENDTERYITSVCKKTGFSRNEIVGNLGDARLSKPMLAMEEQEGFHHAVESRREQWINVTLVQFSDGARPISGLAVKVKRDSKETVSETDIFGRLKPLVHVKPKETVELWVENIKREWRKIDSLVLQMTSQAHVYVSRQNEFRSTAKLHNSPLLESKPYTFSYTVQPGDNLVRIGAKFKVSPEMIQRENQIKNPNKIFAGQIIFIPSRSAQAQNNGSPAPRLERRTDRVRGNAPAKPAVQARSKEGKGHPVSLIPVIQKRAPWMIYAIEEARLRAGMKESEITKSINYHKETGQSGNLATVPWCASFINFCIKSSGYEHSNSASSQSFTWSKAFTKIDEPVFGAIVVYRNPQPKFDRTGKKYYLGHVAFVYCKLTENDLAVLGGNQGDAITFNFHKKTYMDKLGFDLVGFYVPSAYKPYAAEQIRTGGDLGPTEHSLSTLRALFQQSTQLGRNDLATR